MKLIKILFQSILVEIYLWVFPTFNKWVPTMCIRISCCERDSVGRRDCGVGRWWKVVHGSDSPSRSHAGPSMKPFSPWSSPHRSGSLSLRTCIGGQRIQSLPWLFWNICKQLEGRKSALCVCVSCMSANPGQACGRGYIGTCWILLGTQELRALWDVSTDTDSWWLAKF